MCHAYNRTDPDGLSDYSDFTRWRIIGGDNNHWNPYGGEYFDQLALDGLYYITVGNLQQSTQKALKILERSGYYYDNAMQRFVYKNINNNSLI